MIKKHGKSKNEGFISNLLCMAVWELQIAGIYNVADSSQ